MKILFNGDVKYDKPVVKIVEIETTSVLCASTNELEDLKKEDFEFGWGY